MWDQNNLWSPLWLFGSVRLSLEVLHAARVPEESCRSRQLSWSVTTFNYFVYDNGSVLHGIVNNNPMSLLFLIFISFEVSLQTTLTGYLRIFCRLLSQHSQTGSRAVICISHSFSAVRGTWHKTEWQFNSFFLRSGSLPDTGACVFVRTLCFCAKANGLFWMCLCLPACCRSAVYALRVWFI